VFGNMIEQHVEWISDLIAHLTRHDRSVVTWSGRTTGRSRIPAVMTSDRTT
jgi:hypothetical protein